MKAQKIKIFDEAAEDRLLDALDEHNSEDLIAMRSEGYSIASHKIDKIPVLRFALALDNIELSVIETLIYLGCDATEKNDRGAEPILAALNNVNIEPGIIALLIENGADLHGQGVVGLAMNKQYFCGNDNIFRVLGGQALVERMHEHREYEAREEAKQASENAYFDGAPIKAISASLGKLKLDGKNNGKAGLLCIDLSMDADYVRMQDEAFSRVGKQLTIAAGEFSASHKELLSLEDSIHSANQVNLGFLAASGQDLLKLEPSICYFFRIGGVELPKLDLASEERAALDFALGALKTSANAALMPGQALQSGYYYAGLKIYEMLGAIPATQPLLDLLSFTKNCGGYMAAGAVVGAGMGSLLYGAINGAAICFDKHQQLGLAVPESAEQADLRVGIDIQVAIATISHGPIAMISAVIASDMVIKVLASTYDLCMHGLVDSFYGQETA